MAENTGVVNIRGKEYKTVALRVNEFRTDERYAGYALVTEPVLINESQAVFKCSIYNADKTLVATGHAEEWRGQGKINRTSAVENAETSAIGRALAALGLGGTEFASANEVVTAVAQQGTPATMEQLTKIQALIAGGLITDEHLQRAFGRSNVNQLLEVEAARILQAFEAQPNTESQNGE